MCVLLLALFGASRAPAQYVLLVKVGNLQLPVRAAHWLTPQVELDGKLIPVPDPTAPMVLHVADAYCDGLINEEELGIEIREPGFGYAINLQIDGHLTSETDLSNCYFVIMWQTLRTGSYTFMTAELPDLKAGKRTSIQFTKHLPFNRSDFFEGEKYWAHIFSGRRECLTSEIVGQAPEAKWRQLRYLAEATGFRQPTPFFNPIPADLSTLPAARPGSAMVDFRVSAGGDVVGPSVTNSSSPEFGDFALSAVKQWLFAPAIRDNKYVEVPGRFLFTFPEEPDRSIPTLKEYQKLFAGFFGENLIDLNRRDGLSRLTARYKAMSFDQALADLRGRVDTRVPSVVVGERTRLSMRSIFIQAVIRYEADGVAYRASQRLELVYSSDGEFKGAALRRPSYSEQHPIEVQAL
jgi:TonB family protein